MKLKMWSVLTLLFLSVLVDVSSSFAAGDDDYNFSWLDPDKKIYVLQNRRYRKANSVDLFLLGGVSLGDTYRTVYQVQPRIGYWFNEEFGFEALYSDRFNSQNNAYKALDQAISTPGGDVTKSPYIREVNSQFAVLLTWAPWYAKINVFNSVLYFDWYFEGGVGSLSTSIGPLSKQEAPTYWKDENLFAVFLGTGHLFHLSEHWTARLDFLGHFYDAGVYGGNPNAPSDKAIFSNFALNFGFGYQL